MTDKPSPQDDQQQDIDAGDGKRRGDYWSQLPDLNATTDLVQKTLGMMSRPYDVLKGTPADPAMGAAIEDMINRQVNPGDTVWTMLEQKIKMHQGDIAAFRQAVGGWAITGDNTVERMGEAMASHLRRNRDRAIHHITDNHVRQTVERMGQDDWSAFLDAQRDGSDDPDDQLIGRLEATLQDDDRQDVRDGIVRELLMITWARAAWELRYDGDRTQPLEWDDPETGEPRQLVATPDDVTTYLIDEYLKDSEGWSIFPTEYIERDILEALLQTIPKPATIGIPAYAPAFRDGVGHVLTDGIARTFRSRAVGPWDPDEHDWPILRGNWGKTGSHLAGDVLFTVDQTHIDDRDQAWSLVGKIDDADMDVLDYILAKWVANRGSLGDLDGVHFTAKEMLEAWGIKPHHKGGYRPHQYATVASSVSRLMHIGVASRVWVKPAGRGNRKPEPREIYVPLLRGGPGMRDPRYSGRRGAREWVIDPKGWALVYGDMTPQHGRMLQSILQLDPNTDRNIKRIARYLMGIFRIRKGATGQAYRIDTLLGESCVEIDTNQPTRFRTRIEGAMDHLQTIGMVSSWRYLDDVPKGGRGMLDQWLAPRIEIIPTPAAVGKVIETPRRGRRAIATS